MLSMEERLAHFSNKNRRNDNFYVKFFGLPENISNVLGKQVKNLTRPNIDVQTGQISRRSATFKDHQKISLTPVVISFFDDEDSIVSTFMYVQLFRQMNKYPDKFGTMDLGREYKFDVLVQLMNASGEITEEFTLRECFIQNINHSDPNISDDTDTEISITLEYDNVDYKLFDEWVKLGRH